MALTGSAAFFMQEAKSLNAKIKQSQAQYSRLSQIVGTLLKFNPKVTSNNLQQLTDQNIKNKLLFIYNEFHSLKAKYDSLLACVNAIAVPLNQLVKNEGVLNANIKYYPNECNQIIRLESLSKIIRLTNNSKILLGAIDTNQEKTKQYYDLFGTQFLYIYANKIIQSKRQNFIIPDEVFIQQFNLMVSGKFQRQNSKLSKYLSTNCLSFVEQFQTSIQNIKLELKKVLQQKFQYQVTSSNALKQNESLFNHLSVLNQEIGNILNQSQLSDFISLQNIHRSIVLIQKLQKINKENKEKSLIIQQQLKIKQIHQKQLKSIKEQLQKKDDIIQELQSIKEVKSVLEKQVMEMKKKIKFLQKKNPQFKHNEVDQLIIQNNTQRQQIFSLNQNIVLLRRQLLKKIKECNKKLTIIKSQIQLVFSELANKQKNIEDTKQFILQEINTIITAINEKIEEDEQNLENQLQMDSSLQESFSLNIFQPLQRY